MGRHSRIPRPLLIRPLGNSHWAITAFAVALLLIGSLAIAACGGGDGNDEGTGTTDQPAATPVSAATPAAPTPASGELTASGTFNEEELILPEQWESFEVDLVIGDFVRASYTSVPKAVGGFAEEGALGRPGLIFNVNDPIGDSIYRGEQLADGGTEFTAELSGTYQFTFFNPVVRNLQEVKLKYEVNP